MEIEEAVRYNPFPGGLQSNYGTQTGQLENEPKKGLLTSSEKTVSWIN